MPKRKIDKFKERANKLHKEILGLMRDMEEVVRVFHDVSIKYADVMRKIEEEAVKTKKK